jgi:hypothetical protein
MTGPQGSLTQRTLTFEGACHPDFEARIRSPPKGLGMRLGGGGVGALATRPLSMRAPPSRMRGGPRRSVAALAAAMAAHGPRASFATREGRSVRWASDIMLQDPRRSQTSLSGLDGFAHSTAVMVRGCGININE